MPLYEHVYLARQDASAQQVEELTAQLKGVIEGLGGTIKKTEYWGVKTLSYRLRKNRKAHFTQLDLDAPPAAINEIERLERLNEDVLRYLTIRVDELEEGPSAMMRRVDRDRELRGQLVEHALRHVRGNPAPPAGADALRPQARHARRRDVAEGHVERTGELAGPRCAGRSACGCRAARTGVRRSARGTTRARRRRWRPGRSRDKRGRRTPRPASRTG